MSYSPYTFVLLIRGFLKYMWCFRKCFYLIYFSIIKIGQTINSSCLSIFNIESVEINNRLKKELEVDLIFFLIGSGSVVQNSSKILEKVYHWNLARFYELGLKRRPVKHLFLFSWSSNNFLKVCEKNSTPIKKEMKIIVFGFSDYCYGRRVH